MNIDEAFKNMKDGKVISHKFFNDNEYLYIDKNLCIRDESGYNFGYEWKVRTKDKNFKNGWKIVNKL